MVAYFKLIRWPNLLLIVLVQYLIRLGLIKALELPHVLSPFEFALGVIASVLLAAGGYIINDLYDAENDAINKPRRVTIGKQISEGRAWNFYFATVVGAIVSGYFVAEASGLSSLWLVPPLAIVLLYLYAYDLKKRPLVGNLLVSFLAALPVMLVGVYDVLPAVNADNALEVKQTLEVIAAYAGFGMHTHFLRELVKDAQDRRGDGAVGQRTLALLMSPGTFKILLLLLSLALFAPLAYYSHYLFDEDKLSASYLLLFVLAPLLYFIIRLLRAHSATDYKQLSTLLKLIMLTGVLSIVIFTFSFKISMS